MSLPFINELNAYLPSHVVTNRQVEERINKNGQRIAPNSLERLFGCKERRYAASDEQTSDLAAKAARNIVDNHKQDIDCLIFASACSDLLEPATANIVQQKLGLSCPVFDLKNACNSFVNAIQVASSFLQSGMYKNVLITTGEVLHQSIRFDAPPEEDISKRLASFTFGDAGAAALLSKSDTPSGIYYQKFKSNGTHWPLSTIPGGGSMHPHDPDKYFFEGFTTDLRVQLIEESKGIVSEALQTTDWHASEIKHVFTHQVSVPTFHVIAEYAGIAVEKFHNIFPTTGNTAAASIPLSMHAALSKGVLQRGDKILMIGLAAGTSVSVQLMVW